jgi:hypothetical protein
MAEEPAAGMPAETAGLPIDERVAKAPVFLARMIFGTFAWILVGMSFIYGVRLWFNSPIHPNFIPLIGGAFSAALAFTLVLSLAYAIGPIRFQFGDRMKFEGASGPIILWCLCFLTLCVGLYFLGITDAIKVPVQEDRRSILQLFFDRPSQHPARLGSGAMRQQAERLQE